MEPKLWLYSVAVYCRRLEGIEIVHYVVARVRGDISPVFARDWALNEAVLRWFPAPQGYYGHFIKVEEVHPSVIEVVYLAQKGRSS